MFKWIISIFSLVLAIATGGFFLLQLDQQFISKETLNKLHLPLEQTDYFQKSSPALQSQTGIVESELAEGNQKTQSLALSNTATLPDEVHLNWNIVPSKKAGQPEQTSMSASPLDQVKLTRKIQRYLQRAGCKHVSVNGKWDNRTKSSMFKFIENSNASLPIHSPEPALLSLVKHYEGSSCGLQCIGPSCQHTSNDVITSQSVQPVSPPKLAQKPGSNTIVSGWQTQIKTNKTKIAPATVSIQYVDPKDHCSKQ